MIHDTRRWISGASLLAFLLVGAPAISKANPKTFAFVNTQYVITAEVESEHAFVLNFINLSNFVVVIQPNEFIYRGASGRFYIGQVFDLEHKNARGETQKYTASHLLKGNTFFGLTILGAFHEQDRIEEISVRIGAKRFYLQPLDAGAFEQLATKISRLDLQAASASSALYEAGISEMGTVKVTDGTSEWDRDWQGLLTADGINPPKIIERPEIPATSESIRSRTFGKVRLSAIITKNGGIQDLKVAKGLDRGLDKRALEGVKNSWLFLPATKNGEVLDSSIFIEVDFPAPVKGPSPKSWRFK
ncbi:MAG: energy transducer TonB [Acidobacteriota bacterium]|nr:energy transducer TonB [Acidobacteriota bacterium]